MPQPNQDQTARRAQEFESLTKTPPEPRRYDVGYDCEPPPDVRAELTKPKRPVMLRRCFPSKQRSDVLKLAGAVALAAIILAGVIGHYTQSHTPQHIVAPAVQPSPAPISQPTRDTSWQSSSASRTRSAPRAETPRAELVKLPPPRAQLVLYRDAQMPYGDTVHARLLGSLPNQEALPWIGNHLGDMYRIGNGYFVWVAPNGGQAQWVDPVE